MNRHVTRTAAVVLVAAIGCSKPANEVSTQSSVPNAGDSAVVKSNAADATDSAKLIVEPSEDTIGDVLAEKPQPKTPSAEVPKVVGETGDDTDSQEQAFGVFRSLGRAFLRGAANASGSSDDNTPDNSQSDSSAIPAREPTR